MTEQTIGVIVPVYNAEEYLPRCMQSLSAQTYRDLDILLIDDGSADGSGALCDGYAREDGRVRVIHEKNGGAAHARNAGLDACRAGRLIFVDADDTLPPEHVAALDAVMKRYAADVVIAGVRYLPGPVEQHSEALWNADEAIEKILYRDGVGDYPISKLYRREVFAGVRFVEGITSEDFEVFYRLFRNAKRVAVTDATTYFYVQHAGSVSNGGFNPGFFNRLDICERLVRDVKRDCPQLLPAAYSRCVDESIWLYGITPPAYAAQRERMRNTVKAYAPFVRKDPKASARVRRRLAVFTLSPRLWILRMRCKAVLIAAYSKVKG